MKSPDQEPLASLGALIAGARAAAPAALCPPTSLDAIAAMPDVFGPSLSWALFESRLSGPQRVDLAVLLSAGESKTRMRERLFTQPDLWPGAWDGAGRALVAWLLPGHAVAEARQISLEWDCAPSPGVPFPFLTLELAPGVPTAPERALRIAEGLSQAVDNRSLTPCEVAVVKALPRDGSTLHVGCLGERGGGAHRWVNGMPARDAEGFLRALGWKGNAALLGEWATRFGSHAPHISVHLDVAEELGPRVGLDIFFPGPPRTDHRWLPVLSALEELGLATAATLAGLRDWPGEADGVTRLLDLKINFEDRPVQAKAYLAFCATDPARKRRRRRPVSNRSRTERA